MERSLESDARTRAMLRQGSGIGREPSAVGRRQACQTARELCHDLRGPAATIMAVAAAAAVEGEVSQVMEARLAQVVAQARRISELCRDVLDEPHRRSVIAVHDLARDIADATSVRVDTSLRLRAKPSFVHGNSVALGRALSNVVENAVRAAGPDGRVDIDVAEEGPVVRLTVSDSGPGFGAGEAGVGGLGLKIVARVIADHGGELEIAQSGELGGASVIILLPTHSGLRLAGRSSAGRR